MQQRQGQQAARHRHGQHGGQRQGDQAVQDMGGPDRAIEGDRAGSGGGGRGQGVAAAGSLRLATDPLAGADHGQAEDRGGGDAERRGEHPALGGVDHQQQPAQGQPAAAQPGQPVLGQPRRSLGPGEGRGGRRGRFVGRSDEGVFPLLHGQGGPEGVGWGLLTQRTPPIGFAATLPMKRRERRFGRGGHSFHRRDARPLRQRPDPGLQGLHALVENKGEDRQADDAEPDHAYPRGRPKTNPGGVTRKLCPFPTSSSTATALR